MGTNPSVMPPARTQSDELPGGAEQPLADILLRVAQRERKSRHGSSARAIILSSQVVLLLSVLGHIELAAVEAG